MELATQVTDMEDIRLLKCRLKYQVIVYKEQRKTEWTLTLLSRTLKLLQERMLIWENCKRKIFSKNF